MEPYRTRRYQVGKDMYETLGIPRDDRAARLASVAQNLQFFGAPVGLFFIIDRRMGNGQWAHLGMFMKSVALATMEMGGLLHAHFALDPNEVLYCGMAMGFADTLAPVNSLRSTRAPVEEFTTFAGW